MKSVDRAVRRANTYIYRFTSGTIFPSIQRLKLLKARAIDKRVLSSDQSDKRIAEINELAFQHFDTPIEGVNTDVLLSELNGLRADNSALAHEARALLNLAGQKSAIEMRRAITNLQSVRSNAGEVEKFDAFLNYLKERVPPDMLYGHHFGSKVFAQHDHAKIWARIEEIFEELKGFSDQVFLNSGTLLGVVRDKKLIDHDDDIDLAVMLNATTQEEAAREWQSLRLQLIDAGIASPHAGMLGVIKVFFKAGGGCGIDLFPAWINDGSVNVFPYSLGDLSEKDVLPLKNCSVTGLQIPAQPEKVLEANYGSGWRKPDPFYIFPWSLANRRFKTFLTTLKETRPKRVITYGTFDLFHHGHVRLLRRLSQLADEVIVGCSTDKFNELKGKKTAVPYMQRVEMLDACKFVTKVFPENTWEQKRTDILKYKADTFAMGEDWRGEFDELSDICNVVYLPRTENISTTILKDDIRSGSRSGQPSE